MVGQRLSGTIKISHAEQVGKEIGPAVEKRRGRFRGDALGAGYHERVNQFLALLRVGVPHELPNFLRFGQAARQVKRHPTQKFTVGAEFGVRDVVATNFGENEFIDVVVDRDRPSSRGWQAVRDSFGEAA